MIQIIQANMPNTAAYFIEMHRMRAKVFKERLHWNVSVNDSGMEIDEYDLPETVYILSLDDNKKIIGSWRILFVSKHSMIRELWPQYLTSLPIPISNHICEASRFCALDERSDTKNKKHVISQATAEMVVALIDICIKCGVTEMYSFYYQSVKRLMDKIGFSPTAVSDTIPFEGKLALAAKFSMTPGLLDKVCEKTGITYQVKAADLPPILFERYQK